MRRELGGELVIPGAGGGGADHRVDAGRKIGGDVRHAQAIDFVVAHDQVVLAVADRQDGIERRGIDLEVHGSGRGQGEGVQVGEAQAGAATGVGEGAIQLIAKVKRAGGTGLRIAGLEGVLERVVAAGGQVARDSQAVTARGELRAQAGYHVGLRVAAAAAGIEGQRVAGGIQQGEGSGEIAADRARAHAAPAAESVKL